MAGPQHEGVYRRDEGSKDAEGFIAPSVGLVDHALYFTVAPDVAAKTKQVLDEGRLELPGAVIVWDETIGRRKGAKAVPGSWWAGTGSVTMSLVFPSDAIGDLNAACDTVAGGVLAALTSFSPRSPVHYDESGTFSLDGRRLGRLDHESHHNVEIFVVRVNANTDFTKAPKAVKEGHSRLIDYIDEASLPLQKASTLPNTLSLAIMRDVPQRLLYS